jgi:hypothetical protein
MERVEGTGLCSENWAGEWDVRRPVLVSLSATCILVFDMRISSLRVANTREARKDVRTVVPYDDEA